ncbi:MAG: NUDIX domain-containing protein [bacterium]|nr:NUDIX domain-containing protein [bacterium]
MRLGDLLAEARNRILIIGTTAIGEELLRHTRTLAQLLTDHPSLKLSILYESDDELFKQSIGVDRPEEPGLYAGLWESRDQLRGIRRRILESCGLSENSGLAQRIELKQVHLRLPLNIVKVDSEIWAGMVTTSIGDCSSYSKVCDLPWKGAIEDYASSYSDPYRMGAYLYDPENDKKLLQIYDNGTPPRSRGIFPRQVRYPHNSIRKRSVWGFIFNRQGELLLQKRSEWVQDNRNLWDKSFGGHLDAEEDPVTMAKKELIQECFLPAAEDTDYIGEDTSLIMNLGEWIAPSGEEGAHFTDHLAKAYSHLPSHTWCLFAPNLDREGNRIVLESERLLPGGGGEPVFVAFVTDVFFVVAPKELLDDQAQAEENLRHGQTGNAAKAHRLISVGSLLRELEDFGDGFTGDLHYMMNRHQDILVRFSRTVVRMYS